MNALLQLYPGDHVLMLVVNVLVAVTAVILLATIIACCVASHNAVLRHGLWLVTLLCVLASPVVVCTMHAMGISWIELPTVERAMPAAMVSRIESPASPALAGNTNTPTDSDVMPGELSSNGKPTHSSTPIVVPERRTRLTSPATAAVPSAGRIPLPDVLRAAGGLATLSWALGVLFFLMRLAHGWRALGELRRDAVLMDPARLTPLAEQVCAAMGARQLPPIMSSATVTTPITAGLARPVVILPEQLIRTVSNGALCDVLVHEAAHITRRDHLVGFAQRLAESLFWPYPLVYAMNRQLGRAREEVCDNYVLAHGEGPSYAQTLLVLAEQFVPSQGQVAALGLLTPRWRLEDRVASLLDTRRNPMTRLSRKSALVVFTFALFAAGLLFVSVAPAQPNQRADEKGEAKTANETPQRSNQKDTASDTSSDDQREAGSQPDSEPAPLTSDGGDTVRDDASDGISEAIAALKSAGLNVILGDDGEVVDVNQPRGSGLTDSTFEHIGRLTNLRQLRLLQVTQITDAALEQLQGLAKLEQLYLGGAEITGAGLVFLEDMANLQLLELGNTKVTDAGLAHLKALTKLESLRLHGTEVTDAGLVHLKGMPNLRSLSLGHTEVTDAGLMHLTELPHLKMLYLNGPKQCNDAAMEHLKEMSSLRNLDLKDGEITDAGMANLKDMTELQGLSLGSVGLYTANTPRGHYKGITDAGLAHLEGLTNLTFLSIHAYISDAGLGHLNGMTKLEVLYLNSNPWVTGTGLVHLKGMSKLRSLYLFDTEVDDAALTHLAGLTNLKTLVLNGTRVTDAGLVHLKGLTKLQWLSLGGEMVPALSMGFTNVGDAGLVHLKGLTNLRTLQLNRTLVTDAGLEHLKDLPNLQGLHLDDTKISGTGLKYLKDLPKLGNIGLKGTLVTDESLAKLRDISTLAWVRLAKTRITDAGLAHLQDIDGLVWLDLVGTQVSDDAVSHLQRALPNCEIIRHDISRRQ